MNRSLKFDLRQDTKTNITEVVGFFRYFRFSLKISWTLYVVRNTSDGAECHLENGVISKRLIDTNTWLCLLHWASVYHTGTFECVCVCVRARARVSGCLCKCQTDVTITQSEQWVRRQAWNGRSADLWRWQFH